MENKLEPAGMLNRDEWFDAMRKVVPNLTREEFEAEWAEFEKYRDAPEHPRRKIKIH